MERLWEGIMANFYDQWLALSERIQEGFARSPMVAKDEEIPWVTTRQDARVKLMLSDDLGFPTMGSAVMKAEIPVGWHTGKHVHGEESIHILSGTGFSVVGGQRFDWHRGSTLQIPYRAAHQHFNTGDEPVQYLSGMCFPLEAFVKVGMIQQIEDCAANDPSVLKSYPPEESQYLKGGPRVAIHLEQAPSKIENFPKITANQNQHYSTKYLVVPPNGFKALTSVAVTHIFEEPAGYHGGRHKHLEAVLYVLEGEGYTELGGIPKRWQAGDVLHVPPAMWEHEHFNDTGKSYRLLRIQFGIRFWFTEIWPEGYTGQRILDKFGRPIVAGKMPA